MAIMAGLPLLGLDLVLIGKGELVEVSIDDSNLHLFMVRSAAFATFASFTLNYFRRRRPLSSVAPLMYFSFWASIFAPAYIAVYSSLHWKQAAFLLFTAALALMLFRENERESKTIFVNEW
jgi:uncharacterized membrane protein YfcA